MERSRAHRQANMSDKSPRESVQSPDGSQEQVRRLLQHLARTNPYFVLWDAYKKGVSEHSVAAEWGQFLLEQLGPECEEEVEFARAMMELDKLLTLYRDQNLALPNLSFERICFLHFLRGPERMAQTRAALGMLTAELVACTSA